MTTVGLVIESDHVMYLSQLSALNRRSSSTYDFLTDDSLQSADKEQQESRAVAGKRCLCKVRYISKFASAAVLLAAARFSCWYKK